MLITCPKCIGGTVDGTSCYHCDGDAEIDLEDVKFRELAESDFRAITGEVWSAILDKCNDINDIEDKCNDILDKCNDIFEKVNE